jgi:hypothetical protein
MFGDRQVNDSAAVVGEKDEHEQHAAGECRHMKKWQCSQLVHDPISSSKLCCADFCHVCALLNVR